jgi:hypothetical protein
MTIPLVDIRTLECIRTVYTAYLHVYTVYVLFCAIYLFTSNAIKCKRLTSIVFGMVHSDRTVVVLLHKHFNS